MMFEWLGRKTDMAFKWLFSSWWGGYFCGALAFSLVSYLLERYG